MTVQRWLARAFRRIADTLEPSPAVAVATPSAAPALPGDFEPNDVGLHDSHLAGWFRSAEHELFTGFSIGPDDLIADIGCGSGMYARFCADQGASMILIDADQTALDVAIAKWRAHDPPMRAHCQNSLPFPIADGECSKVICIEVLEHVPDPQAFVHELARIGAPGAQYLISVPGPFVENVLKPIAHPAYFEPPNHIRTVEMAQLRGWVEQAGLTVEHEAYYGAYTAIRWWMWWCDTHEGILARHPVLDHFAYAWHSLLRSPHGLKVKHALDQAVPKSQLVLARKPLA